MQSFSIQLQKHLPTFHEVNEVEWAKSSLKQRQLTFQLSDVFVAVAVIVV